MLSFCRSPVLQFARSLLTTPRPETRKLILSKSGTLDQLIVYESFGLSTIAVLKTHQRLKEAKPILYITINARLSRDQLSILPTLFNLSLRTEIFTQVRMATQVHGVLLFCHNMTGPFHLRAVLDPIEGDFLLDPIPVRCCLPVPATKIADEQERYNGTEAYREWYSQTDAYFGGYVEAGRAGRCR